MAGSGLRSRVEVLWVVEKCRRRDWTDTEKARIVEENLWGYRQCAATARRYEISGALLTRWLRGFRSGDLVAEGRPQFMALQVAAEAGAPMAKQPTVVPAATGDERVEITLAKGGTTTARLWTYVRDDRPFGSIAPPAALFYFFRDRGKEHPNRHLTEWQDILQADAYGGYNDLYHQGRKPGPVVSALCWAHARQKFFELPDIAGNVRNGKPSQQISPVAFESVRRIDAIFDIERDINGLDPKARLKARSSVSLAHHRP